MKKDQNLPNKNIYSNNSSGKSLPSNSDYSRNQSPFNSRYRGRSPERRNSRNFSQNRHSRSNSQNNYSRSKSNTTEFVSASSSHSNPRNRHYSNNRSRKSSYNRNRNYSHNRNRSYSNNRNQNYSNNRININTLLPQVTLQSTVKPSVAPKHSHMDYQTYRPMTKPSKTRKTFTKNTFAEHNYNYAHQQKTNQVPEKIHKI